MNWAFAFFLTLLALPSRTAFSDEIRHAWFPSTMTGTWGETAEKCKVKDGSNVVIGRAKYGDELGTCEVRAVIITPGASGITNYAVRSLCTSAKDTTKTEAVNIIVRQQGPDQALMGRSFDNLKSYQRCSAE